MTKLNSRNELISLRKELASQFKAQKRKILVCAGSGCVASGSLEVYAKLKEVIEAKGILAEVELQDHVDHGNDAGLKKCGCLGLCQIGPLVKIEPEGWLYCHVKPEDAEEIVAETVVNGKVVERLLFEEDDKVYKTQDEIPFYQHQVKIALENCGEIRVDSIDEYIAVGGYTALEKALFDMTPDEIIDEVSKSGLRGRGGAGFPTGKKWAQVAAHKDAPVKYVVCNGDEGDPGAFMDCSIMEGVPHQMIEGMIIAAIATGSSEGYIYVRAEYPRAVERLTKAIIDAEEYGILGDDILGSGKSFNLRLSRGAGAFVCGEGSAMQTSIEGHRGTPRTKPPRSVDKGLFDAPTSLNNVETFANVPAIINKGSKWYSSIGSENNSGTKAFSLAGNIRHTGLIEVPMGTTLGEIIFDIGGGVKSGEFKAVQIGGPSGGCLTKEQLDLPMDFDSTKKIGAIIGSGGMVVMSDDTCMVEIARFFMSFTRKESCGKCTTCRKGIPKMLGILERITEGEGTLEDLDELERLAKLVKTCSLCGLGKTATNPVMSTLKYFRDEYVAHVVDKKCPAKVCKNLFTIRIDPEKCVGCTKCAHNCPADAITGKLMKAHSIDLTKCTRCRTCVDGCPTEAIIEEV